MSPAEAAAGLGSAPVLRTDFRGLRARGKVRDLYDLPDRLMIVCTDRISAFDVVMDDPVPSKGAILTQITAFWLNRLRAAQPHHLDYIVTASRVPAGYEPFAAALANRSMVVFRADVLPIECVVRGYLAGGGWKEYCECGRVSGIVLPPGLENAQPLAEPIFTPSTKAASGHDQPISFEQACEIAADFASRIGHAADQGRRWMHEARARALAVYSEGRDYAASRGILIADTKFEFGVRDGELLLVDEVLTPDSSRFWPRSEYRLGRNPPSFDKQYLRDYLESLPWKKQPPPPKLPAEVIENTRRRYQEALQRLTETRPT